MNDFQQALDSIIDGGATTFPSFIASGMGYAYDTIYNDSYHAVNNPNPVARGTVAVGNYGDANFDRFCSGTSYLPHSFGTNLGFADHIYMTGEEVGGGKFYALDSATRAFWEVSDVGSSPGDYIRMYVGKKGVDVNSDDEIDFLERNGLRGGTVYFFDPDGAASTTDLPDGEVAGKWSTSTVGALQETKLEDIHTNPTDGTQTVFADQTDGVYRMYLDLQFTGDMLDTMASTVTINQIADDDTGDVGNPDNLTWSANGLIYVQEDGNGNDMWHMNDDGTGLKQLVHALSEPSGIYDVSGHAGYTAGSVLLISMQGTGSRPAQLSVLISPGATAIPELKLGDLDSDGIVDVADLGILGANDNLTGVTFSEGDLNGDGSVDVADLGILGANWSNGGQVSDAQGLQGAGLSALVPEPATPSLLAVAALMVGGRRR